MSGARKYDVVLWITNDCEPYEWTDESLQRFYYLIDYWQKHGPFHLLISGGIPNKNGGTIAHAIMERMSKLCPGSENYFLQIIDDKSCETAEAVTYCTSIFREYCRKFQVRKPRLFVLSDFWHLVRIWILFVYKGILIRRIVSPTSGGWKFRLKRLLNELFLIIITVFDPNYRLTIFEKERRRRKDLALTRDLREPRSP